MTNSMAVANSSGEYGIVDLPGTSTVSYKGSDISPQLLVLSFSLSTILQDGIRNQLCRRSANPSE